MAKAPQHPTTPKPEPPPAPPSKRDPMQRHVDVTGSGVDARLIDIDIDWREGTIGRLEQAIGSRAGASLSISEESAVELHARLGTFLKNRAKEQAVPAPPVEDPSDV